MPTINKLPKKEKKERNNPAYTDHKLLRRTAYNTTAWRKLRLSYLKQHPICEDCLSKGKVVAAEDIHHKISPFDYNAGTVNNNLLLDENNLVALCKECHAERHRPKNSISPEELLAVLDDFMKDIPDL